MDEKTFLGLAPGFFAQQPGQPGKVEYRQPKVVGLTQEAQDMIDMFSELDEAQCNELAKLFINNKTVNYFNDNELLGQAFNRHHVAWISKKV